MNKKYLSVTLIRLQKFNSQLKSDCNLIGKNQD